MTRKKISNAILEANGGLDSSRALKTAHTILRTHDLKRPYLYHVVITGGDIAEYQAVIKKLIGRIRSKCRAEYFGAYEVAENRDGEHAHLFIIIETTKNNPFKFLDIREGGYLLKLAKDHKLVKSNGTISPIHVAKPKNAMHGGQFFARPDKHLTDCLQWCTYEFKKRSKEGVNRREIYFNSEFAANTVKRAEYIAKLTTRKAKPVPVPAPPAPSTGLPVALPIALPVEGHLRINGLNFQGSYSDHAAPPGWFDLGKGSEIKVEVGLLRPLNGRIMGATANQTEQKR